MNSNDIRSLEEYAMNAFPALTTNLYDGWILRFSNGYTYRGNCITPLYSSHLDFTEKVDYCHKRYQELNLPTIFKLNESMDASMDSYLASQGYRNEKEVSIMTRTLNTPLEIDTSLVRISHQITDQWLEDFYILNETFDSSSKQTISASYHSIQNPVLCASIYEENQVVACGLGVIEQNHIGLFDIRVRQTQRHQGFGQMICNALLKEGQSHPVTTAYLQVAATNEIALKLYHKLDFEIAYSYWYRVKNR